MIPLDSKAYLEEVQRLDILISAARRKMARQKAVATSITAQMGGERVQSTSTKQRMAEAMDSSVDTERDELQPLIRKRGEILDTLKKVRGSLRFIVLYEHYFNRKGFKTIAREKRYSYAHIIRAHREGLAEVQKIIGESRKDANK